MASGDETEVEDAKPLGGIVTRSRGKTSRSASPETKALFSDESVSSPEDDSDDDGNYVQSSTSEDSDSSDELPGATRSALRGPARYSRRAAARARRATACAAEQKESDDSDASSAAGAAEQKESDDADAGEDEKGAGCVGFLKTGVSGF